MKVLSGAERPDAGEMRLDGAAYAPADPQAARRAGVAMIYQELSLAPHLTVAENILLASSRPAVVRGPARPGRHARTRGARAGGAAAPRHRTSTVVGTLPIAAQQIVEIARAVAVGCRVLVLDEPTSSLAQSDAEALFALVSRLRAQGHAIVYITHFIEEAQRLADRFTVLRDGQSVGGGPMAAATVPAIVDLMVGRRVEQLYPRGARVRGEALLEVDALQGMGKPAHASFTLHRGEVLGIAGLVGAGRGAAARAGRPRPRSSPAG